MVDVALADVAPVKGAHGRQRSVFVFAFDAGNFVGVYPAVSRDDAFFFAFFEENFVTHANIIIKSVDKVKRKMVL